MMGAVTLILMSPRHWIPEPESFEISGADIFLIGMRHFDEALLIVCNPSPIQQEKPTPQLHQTLRLVSEQSVNPVHARGKLVTLATKFDTLKIPILIAVVLGLVSGLAAQDTIPKTPVKDTMVVAIADSAATVQAVINPADTVLRIINLNPFFTIHVDSVLEYDLQLNKPEDRYYFFMRNSPVGVKLDRQSGRLNFKADKSFFKSGRLRYDLPYRVDIGVQNLYHVAERFDTSFTIVFYSTEIIPSRLKPTVSSTQQYEEGDSVRFRVQCETGTFPIEQIVMNTNAPINNYRSVNKCNDEFLWMIPYDFIRDADTSKPRMLYLQFIGNDKFLNKDTALVSLLIRPGVNYPQKSQEHAIVNKELTKYIQDLKLTFYVVSRNVKSNKKTRTGFDVTGSTMALAGTVINTTVSAQGGKDLGKILPSVGLTLVPVKEAVAPNKIQEQNTATQVRAAIKRLEYMQSENLLVGERDPEILTKIKKIRDEMKQTRLQLVDLPMVEFENVSQRDVDEYFNSPKVNKRYKLKIN